MRGMVKTGEADHEIQITNYKINKSQGCIVIWGVFSLALSYAYFQTIFMILKRIKGYRLSYLYAYIEAYH